jgi:hypothetical protein
MYIINLSEQMFQKKKSERSRQNGRRRTDVAAGSPTRPDPILPNSIFQTIIRKMSFESVKIES